MNQTARGDAKRRESKKHRWNKASHFAICSLYGIVLRRFFPQGFDASRASAIRDLQHHSV